MSIRLGRKLLIDSYKKQLTNELREKNKKKGVLIKILNSNEKRSKTLVQILKETDQPTSSSSSSSGTTDDEFLKKYNQMPKGGPKHSIAVARAHHLTNFLSEYLINAFQSGHFNVPDFDKHEQTLNDSNGFLKGKYSFEISNVELRADLTRLKIYWLASGNESLDLKIEAFLDKTLKKQIRSTLVDQRVMNYVPEVEFIRDNTKVLLDKLDEYLLKIKLEHNESSEAPSSSSESTSNESFEKMNIKTSEKKVDNLFGVNFNRLVETIKKNSDYVPWSNETPQTTSDLDVNKPNELVALNKESSLKDKIKFEDKLRAFQINQRIKRERLSKSAILKMDTLEFYESLNKNSNNYD